MIENGKYDPNLVWIEKDFENISQKRVQKRFFLRIFRNVFRKPFRKHAIIADAMGKFPILLRLSASWGPIRGPP